MSRLTEKHGQVTEMALVSEHSALNGDFYRLTFIHADGTRRPGTAMTPVNAVERATAARSHRYPAAIITVDGKPVA